MNSRAIFSMLGLATLLFAIDAHAIKRNTVVADSLSHFPLPNASVFDRYGKVVGICDSKGRIPYIPTNSYPLTIRYLGFKETVLPVAGTDTLFLQEITTELPEVIVESGKHKIMHMLAYVREYSTLTTFTDTVFLFREKMVDYMLPPPEKSSLTGWSNPRILKAKSYYRFTNSEGLDSVSDESRYHFSWSDWIGAGESHILPKSLRHIISGTDTVRGKYSPTEIWTRNGEQVTIDINVLADTNSRKWVPDLSGFFHQNLEFENFRLRYRYNDTDSDQIKPINLTAYSFNIESRGRGHNMFRFNRVDEPFFVNTYAEVYIIDKEYITIKEARKWERLRIDTTKIDIYEPMEAPELQADVAYLVERVNTINKDQVRLRFTPDPNLGSRRGTNKNFRIGNRILMMLKQLTGITLFKSHKNFNRQWENFRKERRKSK